MPTWVYLASEGRANESDTLAFAIQNNAIYRCARDSRGSLIGNVGSLLPGDSLLLAYRQTSGEKTVCVCATIAHVTIPVAGTHAIDPAIGSLREQLIAAGYPVETDTEPGVIRLDNVRTCSFNLRGQYEGQTSIRQLDAEDNNWEQMCCGLSDDMPTSNVSFECELPLINIACRRTDDNLANSIKSSRSGDRIFDAYLMVDWSSRNAAVAGPNSIWVGSGEWNEDEPFRFNEAENYRTRSSAIHGIRQRLTTWSGKDLRILLGFDFAFGYPSGYATALGLNFERPWLGVFEHYAGNVLDDIDGRPNRHNRDVFASACNARINGGGPGPFWGCQPSVANNVLTSTRLGFFDFPYANLQEFRITERRIRNRSIPQSVWKLNNGVSVGGQTIMGIPYLHRLRYGSGELLGNRIKIWPFETGWSIPETPSIVLTEIFPSLLPLQNYGGPRDLDQVLTCVNHAATLDVCGRLADSFNVPIGLTTEELTQVETEEGWILFS